MKLEVQQIPAAVAEVLAVSSDVRTEEQTKILADHVTHHVRNEIRAATESFETAKKAIKDYRDVLPTSMVMKEGKRRDAFVLERGEYDQTRDKVERELPAFLPAMTTNL